MEELEIEKGHLLITFGLIDKDKEIEIYIQDTDENTANSFWMNKPELINLSKHINKIIDNM